MFSLGYCFLTELPHRNLPTHEHLSCIIESCRKCWWKKITTTNNKKIYSRTRKCPCKNKTVWYSQRIARICTFTNAAEWHCEKCSTKPRKIRHLYRFPTQEEDLHIFQVFPMEQIIYYYPPYTRTKCNMCKILNLRSYHMGYIWPCQSSHFEQSDILDENFQNGNMVQSRNEKKMSFNNMEIQVDYFNDKLRKTHLFICHFCSNKRLIHICFSSRSKII